MAEKSSILISSVQEVEGALFASIPADEIDREKIVVYTAEDRSRIGRSYRSLRIKVVGPSQPSFFEFLVSEILPVAEFVDKLREKLGVPATEVITLKHNGTLIPVNRIFAEFKLQDPLTDWIEIEATPSSANLGWWSRWYCELI